MNKYDALNPMQREAVFHTEGPLLILAGAGSGKTRALTYRISYLIEEAGVRPWNILAITFTNKAAEEMRERVNGLVEEGADSVWVSTFHSMCVRILRRFIENIGYETDFSIYDSDDSRTLMKQILKDRDVNPKQYRERDVLGIISAAKNEMVSPEEYMANARAAGDWRGQMIGELYLEYQNRLKKNNALDFDDLLVKTVELFTASKEILDYYQERFRYIMVDEYQDTNTVQFRLVSLLAEKYGNICVVGDDDQSIYRFRGADIKNILSFEQTFPGARVIRLEQNYRSTKMILEAANQVIRNNAGRKEKTLWTENETGEKLLFRQFDTSYDEAEWIVRDMARHGGSWKDYAVLYRTNAQSRLLEEKCIACNVPYRLIGGVNFYQRKEIKDILCYLKTIANGRDDLAVQRIINVPKRGIGAATIAKINLFAAERGMSFYDTLLRIQAVPGIGRAASKIQGFTEEIGRLRLLLEEGAPVEDVIQETIDSTGYREELMEEGETEAQTRLENIDELINKAASYWEEAEEPTLSGFLEEVALVADVDSLSDQEERVVLMTLHSAKGLEFPYVYMSGMEEGLFPSSRAVSEDEDAIEEERRLCYVGITRAEKRLTLTSARQRMTRGEVHYSRPSRFVEEIPEECMDWEDDSAGFGSFGRSKERFADEGGLPWESGTAQKTGLPWEDGTAKKTGLPWEDGMAQKKALSWDAGFSQKGTSLRRGSASGAGENTVYQKRDSYGVYESLKSGGSAKAFSGSGRNMIPKTAPGFGKTFTVEKEKSLEYGPGDRVRHERFGEGTVKEISDGGRDYEVTVEFDTLGTRKMFASFAKLKKLEKS